MGSRPSGFKSSGGFLNNVDAVFEDYNFTAAPEAFSNSKPKKGKKKGDDDSEFTALYAELTFKVDGSDDTETTTVFAGNADDFEISDDGKSLTPIDGGALYGGKPFAKFIESLVLAGFPESNLPDDDEPINYEAALGTRMRLTQRVDEEATKRLGKKKSKDGKKEYDRKDTVVDKVYSLPGDSKPAAKGSKPTAGKPAKGKGKEFDLDEASAEILVALLGDAKDNTLQKAHLPNLLVKAIKKDNPNREDIRRRVYSDDFLETENGWSYDASSKKQLIVLASAEDDE